eukprot:5697349-Alexandrium_andersonii.AAC.1
MASRAIRGLGGSLGPSGLPSVVGSSTLQSFNGVSLHSFNGVRSQQHQRRPRHALRLLRLVRRRQFRGPRGGP